MENDYNFQQKVFKDAIYFGTLANLGGLNGKEGFVVGGAATQISLKDSPHILRATADVDLAANVYLPNSKRKEWARTAEQIAKGEGYDVKAELTRQGAGIRFLQYNPDFLLHLDCTGKKTFQHLEEKQKREIDRARKIEIRGLDCPYQCIEDNIANKYNRISHLTKEDPSLNNSYLKQLKKALKEGFIGEIAVPPEELVKMLKKVQKTRSVNLEALADEGYRKIIRRIQQYKIEKDVYDILCLVSQLKEDIDTKLVRRVIKELPLQGN